jgi:leucyl aminopeptidase
MKVTNASLLALLLPAVSGRFVESGESDRSILYPDGLPKPAETGEKYHIELSPGETRWVTEDEKWELRRVRLSWFHVAIASPTLVLMASIPER